MALVAANPHPESFLEPYRTWEAEKNSRIFVESYKIHRR
jgi:hypothetical protein